MVSSAIKEHNLKLGEYIVEASSGNTAIYVAFVARKLGLNPIIVVSRQTSVAKVKLIKILGAEIFYGSDDKDADDYYIK
ncbi:pyridoxal-phosphate dependent enzyme [Fervidicoccus fontis]|uniref:Cysteine synthase B n=2 Tax=Fervidicoccus fontis TaxID=683846 RepID=I0A2D4_FERFK|nr:cysteine synthase B [Fervidicoccus fontis Kam940]MBE9390520.1 pyridoxal-phosphate dependent enzyme [Fervidicoccus fontis]PMB75851.1 MAG: cysteine synthase A [Fervidicoccus fontis]PMB77730.1 MAG: cysteine synthase A [Fervidicoccus fontis]HEW64272.1 pyridoxal-phosphate dependent enzyme [Fervidicoccus fontis]